MATPSLVEMGITGRAAAVLEQNGLTTRHKIEEFGLENLEAIKWIGDEFADEIRQQVAASYVAAAEPVAVEPEPVAEPDPPIPSEPVAVERATVTAVTETPLDKSRLDAMTAAVMTGFLANPVLSRDVLRDETGLASTAVQIATALLRGVDRA